MRRSAGINILHLINAGGARGISITGEQIGHALVVVRSINALNRAIDTSAKRGKQSGTGQMLDTSSEPALLVNFRKYIQTIPRVTRVFVEAIGPGGP